MTLNLSWLWYKSTSKPYGLQTKVNSKNSEIIHEAQLTTDTVKVRKQPSETVAATVVVAVAAAAAQL